MNRHYPRSLSLDQLLRKKSFFLFGPRSTGKSTLIRKQLAGAKVFDLLDREVFASLVRRPKLISESLRANKSIVVIDEIQKFPQILDEVHRLIETKNVRFLLTGSSARKLKRGAANLLAGRAWQANLFPLTWTEIDDFDLLRYLNQGGLPNVYLSSSPEEELRSYAGLYLQEEIQAEALTRNIEGFAAFLDIVALSNGEEINYQSMSSDCGVPARTLSSYISILKDTLVGYALAPFLHTKKRKAITREKLFLFDIGVVNALANRGTIKPKSELFGKAFEHFIINECIAYSSYQRIHLPMYYWRSTSQFEVDLVIGNKLAIEIKSTDLVSDKHMKGIRALKEEALIKNYCVVSNDPYQRVTDDGITIYPWTAFLKELNANRLLK